MPRTTNIKSVPARKVVTSGRTSAAAPNLSNFPEPEDVPKTNTSKPGKSSPTVNPVLEAVLIVCEDKLAQLRDTLSNPKKNAADEKNDMYKRGLSLSEGARIRSYCSGASTDVIQDTWRQAVYNV